jgi:hypothetical protein
VIVAMITSGRETPRPEPPAAAVPEPLPSPAPEPQVVVVDHHDPQPEPVYYPVPVYVPVASAVDGRRGRNQTVTTTISTDQGIVKARVPVPPNCVKAQPVYWGFGGKLRPGSWEPPPTVVCQ